MAAPARLPGEAAARMSPEAVALSALRREEPVRVVRSTNPRSRLAGCKRRAARRPDAVAEVQELPASGSAPAPVVSPRLGGHGLEASLAVAAPRAHRRYLCAPPDP